MSAHSVRRTPWGRWQVLLRSSGYQVKQLVVNPGHRFSLQFHYHRSEHWVVVAGSGRMILGPSTFKAVPGRHFFIPQRVQHRLQNTGKTPLVVIEVQRGAYLGEEDIVRLQDDYHRV